MKEEDNDTHCNKHYLPKSIHEVKCILISKSVRLWDFLKKENERYGHPNNDLQKKN